MASVLPRDHHRPLLTHASHTYVYDAENRVVSIDSGAWTFVYDALGRRLRKTNGTTNYDVIYDLNGHVQRSLTNGTVGAIEIYAGGQHLATYENSDTIFHATDWLGSERRNTDHSGTTQQTCTNLPFGDVESCTGVNYATEFFTGDEHDSESNTEHTLYRQLATTQGRWLTPDPYMGSMDLSNPQSLNRYSHVLNNPVNAIDPLGLTTCYLDGMQTDCANAEVPEFAGAANQCPGSCSYYDFDKGQFFDFDGTTYVNWATDENRNPPRPPSNCGYFACTLEVNCDRYGAGSFYCHPLVGTFVGLGYALQHAIVSPRNSADPTASDGGLGMDISVGLGTELKKSLSLRNLVRSRFQQYTSLLNTAPF